MRALYVILPILGILVLAYRYYSAFIAARVLVLDDTRTTPAHTRADGHNYHATTRWVLFGHHFAAIAGSGPLIGPVLAAQFGYAPGLIWLVGGVCLAGAVHDRSSCGHRRGEAAARWPRSRAPKSAPSPGPPPPSPSSSSSSSRSPASGSRSSNALSQSAWGTFTIGASIPLAIVHRPLHESLSARARSPRRRSSASRRCSPP